MMLVQSLLLHLSPFALLFHQALYEKHKVLTYPRTDSKALPEDYMGTVNQTLKSFVGLDHGHIAGAYVPFC